MSQNSIYLTPTNLEYPCLNQVNDMKLINKIVTTNIAKTSYFQLKAYDRSLPANTVNDNLDELFLKNSKSQKKSEIFGKYLTSFERLQLQKNLQEDLPKKYRQRIEIMLLADEGKKQIEIKKAIGCCQDTVRRWVLMARSGMALFWKQNQIGRPKIVDERYLNRLKELVTKSPKEFGYCFERWTANSLRKQLLKELNIEVSDRHINRLLHKMGLSTKKKTLHL